jgi:hypothetical protein
MFSGTPLMEFRRENEWRTRFSSPRKLTKLYLKHN